jgi:TRAP transporter TAXI family solute receptor
MATTLSSYGAYKATGIYKGGKPGQVLSWLSIAPVAMHVITLDGGPVKTLADLKGKRVGMGQPGGTSMLDADALIEQLGLDPGKDFKDFRVRLGNMTDMLGDGNLDVALWNGSFPLPPVIKLTTQHKVKLIPISDDFYNKLRKKYPPYFRISIPAGTYKGIDTETPTFGLGNAMIIHSKIPEDLVYKMTKAIITNLDHLKGVHPAFGRVNKNTVLNGFGAPLHPGALRYYREIGIPGIEEFVKRTSAK